MPFLMQISSLLKEIQHRNHQKLSPNNLLRILKQYKQDGAYLLKKFGWESFRSFWISKLFNVDEGGEFDLLGPFVRRIPYLVKTPLVGSPFKIEIEHTTVCNKKCTLCSHTHFHEKQEQMSFENFKRVVDGCSRLSWINFAGIGSNFLNRDFMRMLEYSRSKHLCVNFVDEFDFITEDISRKLIELGVNSIYVSIDSGNPETFNKLKFNCDFYKTQKNVQNLLNLKKEMNSPFPVVHFRLIISKLNFHELPDYIDFVSQFQNRGTRARVEMIGLIPFKEIEHFYLPWEDIPPQIVSETLKRALQKNINLYFAHEKKAMPPLHECVRWMEPFVLVNGNVIPDCAILMQSRRSELDRFSLGNAFKDSIDSMWTSQEYRKFREMVVNPFEKVPEACVRCCTYSSSERQKLYGIKKAGIS